MPDISATHNVAPEQLMEIVIVALPNRPADGVKKLLEVSGNTRA